jgi:exo-beta-1,3-glucanase (GH17 family)
MSTTDTTIWKSSVDTFGSSPVASLTCSLNGGKPTNFSIKSVCYSPCPIGGSNAFGPNIGDWFWDEFKGVSNWSGTWLNDIPMISHIGANTIRVYCFLETQLHPTSQTQVFTHKKFLDACHENGLYVIVGIPLPQSLFIQGGTPQPSAKWWTDVLKKTVTEVANHPAVLGFTIANEVDNGAVDTYGLPSKAKHWWKQVQAMAHIAKVAAPNKLVGIANHDDPKICEQASSYMANCPDIDYWGVNTYQPKSFASVFGGYAKLTGTALKPVILTEYGFPSTSRTTADTLNPAKIYSNCATQANVVAILQNMLPAAYAEPLNLGLCYFEFCDEWWNQSGYHIPAKASCPDVTSSNAPASNTKQSSYFVPPNVYTWYGGPIACGFPNYYWDNDGFGLYSVAVGQERNPSQPWNSSTNKPALPIDTRNPRTGVIKALKKVFHEKYPIKSNWSNLNNSKKPDITT